MDISSPNRFFNMNDAPEFPDSILLVPEAAQQAVMQDRPRLSLSLDVLVYLGIAALIGLVWQVSRLELFKAGDDTGYWLGVAGGVMMLLLFTYPLRKHFRFTRSWGRVKWWFLAHMLMGVGGPLLILLHSTFRVGSLNAAVALYSMLAVAASGVVGRFLFVRVNRGLRAEQVSLEDLQRRAGLQQEDSRSRLSFAPRVEKLLADFLHQQSHTRAGWLSYLKQVFWLPIRQYLTYRACLLDLDWVLQRLAQREHWSAQDFSKRQKNSQQLVSQYLVAVTRVAQFKAYQKLFSLWHVAHIPVVYLLLVSALVHVVAVHAY